MPKIQGEKKMIFGPFRPLWENRKRHQEVRLCESILLPLFGVFVNITRAKLAKCPLNSGLQTHHLGGRGPAGKI